MVCVCVSKIFGCSDEKRISLLWGHNFDKKAGPFSPAENDPSSLGVKGQGSENNYGVSDRRSRERGVGFGVKGATHPNVIQSV